MELYSWLTGIFFIACGLLVRKYPILIAGYNTMRKEQKEKVDIKGLSAFLCKGFVVMGSLQIALFYLCRLVGAADAAISVMSVATFVVLIYMLVSAQKFDHNKRNVWQLVFIITFLLVVAGSVVYSIRSDSGVPEITLTSGKLSVSGIYGMDLPVQDIRSISLTDTLPALSYRSNGLAVGHVRKGHFRQKDGQTCTLFLVTDQRPFIRITPSAGETVYLNLDTPVATRRKYEELSKKLLEESARQPVQEEGTAHFSR